MKGLPVELISAVAENISSTTDLLSLRSVNSTCHHLVTPHALGKIHIRNSVKSSRNCQSILDSPALATYVREVIYDQRNHSQSSRLLSGAQVVDCAHELEIAQLEDALIETFSSLAGFENLERIVLNFWPSFHSMNDLEVQEQPFWFTNRQVTVLHAVHHAIRQSRVRSLTLNNIILLPPSSYDFVSIVTDSPLYHLSLSVYANSELACWSGSTTLNGSLGSLLPTSNANLKSLVLQSPRDLYHSSNMQLGSLHYPALETLVLENIIFDQTPYPNGIEEFIIRHKASLRHLELRSCTSYVGRVVSSPVRKWSEIWKRFEDELTTLTEIVVSDPRQGYAALDMARGYIPHPLFSLPLVEITPDRTVDLANG